MKNLLILSLIALTLSACATGTIISKEGKTDQAKWHKVDDVILNKKAGTFPNVQNLNQVRAGMTKDQLYALIGRPQYEDGWRAREWNYLFHFTTADRTNDTITTCQFKILFDQEKIARSFYWNPIQPKGGLCPPSLELK